MKEIGWKYQKSVRIYKTETEERKRKEEIVVYIYYATCLLVNSNTCIIIKFTIRNQQHMYVMCADENDDNIQISCTSHLIQHRFHHELKLMFVFHLSRSAILIVQTGMAWPAPAPFNPRLRVKDSENFSDSGCITPIFLKKQGVGI